MNPVTCIVMSQAFNQGVFTGARFLAAVYAVHIGASPFVVGVLMSLFSLAPTLLTVPAGRLIDRIGTRAPLQLSYVVMCALLLVPFFWLRLELLYLVIPVIGTGFFVIYVGASSLANHHSAPEERAASFSKMSVGVATGQGLAPLLLGFCADHLGYAAAFAVIAIFPLLSWVMFPLGGLKHLGPRASVAQAQVKQTRTLDLLRDPRLRSVYVISTLFFVSWDIFLVMTPIYGAHLGLSASQIGMLMGAFSIASFVVRFLGATLSRHFTPWQLLLIALVVQAAGSITYGMVQAMPLLMTAAFFVGLGYGLCSPMSTTAIYEVAPTGRQSEAAALRLSLGMAAQSILPLIVGSAGAFLAAGPIFWVSGLILLAGAAGERRQWTRKPADPG